MQRSRPAAHPPIRQESALVSLAPRNPLSNAATSALIGGL